MKITRKDIIEVWSYFRQNARNPSELKRLEALDFMKEAAIAKLPEEKVTKKRLSEKKMWELVQKANWKKDHNYERIGQFWQTLPVSVASDLKDFCEAKVGALADKFHEDWLGDPGIGVSDDGWTDLTSECVGRGEKFYKSVTVKKLQKMADNDDYHENFMYSFQSLKKY